MNVGVSYAIEFHAENGKREQKDDDESEDGEEDERDNNSEKLYNNQESDEKNEREESVPIKKDKTINKATKSISIEDLKARMYEVIAKATTPQQKKAAYARGPRSVGQGQAAIPAPSSSSSSSSDDEVEEPPNKKRRLETSTKKKKTKSENTILTPNVRKVRTKKETSDTKAATKKLPAIKKNQKK